MSVDESKDSVREPIRLWPGIVLAVLLVVVRFVVPAVVPDAVPYAMLGALGGSLLILLWWAFFSRVPHPERWGGLVLTIAGLYAVRPLLHESVAMAGMGFLFFIYAVPAGAIALVLWAVIAGDLAPTPRRLWLVVAILLACGTWTLVRSGGIDNQGNSDFAWRWTPTPEELLLARSGDEPVAASAAPIATHVEPEWPGFRGPRRDATVFGVRIETDWSASPPVELWRHPVGPGWSSFAVRDDVFYTQEQRGDGEAVSAYLLSTGEPLWRHEDATRFWEANAGAGPRATPTLEGDRVYTFGATGILNTLDAADGSLVWSRDVAADTGVEVPIWGFSSSPLVVGDVVVVAAVGKLAAYDRDSGKTLWLGPDGGDGYSSPHLLRLGGVEQVLLASLPGVVGVAPVDGAVLWQYDWPGGTRIVQPAATADGELLISRGVTTGMRRIAVTPASVGWSIEERWTSNRLKPYFSDFVVHRGHAYGFDGNILASIDVESGERNWKGGRYGSGQLVLLADQDALLVVSEYGELALVRAVPDGFTELARFPAIEGKTWNHPVLVGDVLLVRNGREMAAFRLGLASG